MTGRKSVARLLVTSEILAGFDLREAFRAFLQGDDGPQRRTNRPPVAKRRLDDVEFLLRIGHYYVPNLCVRLRFIPLDGDQDWAHQCLEVGNRHKPSH